MFGVAARRFVAVAVLGTKPSVATVDDEVHAPMFRRADTSDIGATRRRQGDLDGARAGFHECLRRVPTHPPARAALGIAASLPHPGSPVDLPIAKAVTCAG